MKVGLLDIKHGTTANQDINYSYLKFLVRWIQINKIMSNCSRYGIRVEVFVNQHVAKDKQNLNKYC